MSDNDNESPGDHAASGAGLATGVADSARARGAEAHERKGARGCWHEERSSGDNLGVGRADDRNRVDEGRPNSR